MAKKNTTVSNEQAKIVVTNPDGSVSVAEVDNSAAEAVVAAAKTAKTQQEEPIVDCACDCERERECGDWEEVNPEDVLINKPNEHVQQIFTKLGELRQAVNSVAEACGMSKEKLNALETLLRSNVED